MFKSSSAKECHLYGYKTYSEVLDSSSFLFKYALASFSLSEFNKSSLSSPIFKALLPNNLESVTLASSPWQLIVWSAVRNCGLVLINFTKLAEHDNLDPELIDISRSVFAVLANQNS